MEQQLARVAAIRAIIEEVRTLKSIVQNIDRENFFMRDELNSTVQVQMGNLQASFTEIIQVQIDPMLGALASRVDTLYAAMGDNNASINVMWEAVAGPIGYGATYRLVAAVDDGEYRAAAFFVDVPTDPEEPTRVGVLADQFVVVGPGYEDKPFTVEGGKLKGWFAAFDVVEAGKLQSANGKMLIDLDAPRIRMLS